jgi:hypothetical protein
MTFNIGNFGIILTRRYLLYIVVTITVGLAIYLFVLNESEHNHELSKALIYDIIGKCIEPISDITWDEFRKDVGYAAFMNNP